MDIHKGDLLRRRLFVLTHFKPHEPFTFSLHAYPHIDGASHPMSYENELNDDG